jgi:acetyltransferase-like isoleucine patch superfamily enzyme
MFARIVAAMRRARLGIMHRNVLMAWPVGVTLGRNVRVISHNGGRIDLGRGITLMDNVTLEVGPAGHIFLDDDVWVHIGAVISSRDRIHIGRGSMIGEYSSIRDSDHGIAAGQTIRSQSFSSAPVVVGDDVWIGRGVAVLKGVTIGDRSVVGANAVVTDDVPTDKIAAGIPARVLRSRA